MKKHFVWTLIFLGFLFLKAEAHDDSKYFKLVERVKSGDTTVDFGELRIAYAHTKLYSPYGRKANVDAAADALKKENYREAITHAENEFKTNYPTLDGHLIAFIAHKRLGDSAKADFHRWVYSSLVNSILNSGKGTLEEPWIVINTGEEYNIIREQFQLRSDGQALQHHNGHSYDVIEATDPETGDKYTFYFQVDLLFNSMKRMFDEGDE